MIEEEQKEQEQEQEEEEKSVLHVPNDDNVNDNIKYVFPIIHENYIEKNGVFKQYLCDILDKKYTHHIFNTYLYFNQKILGFYINGYFTFFILLALKSSWTISSTLLNKSYKELSNDEDPENKYNFDVEMSEIINLFINIFKNPEDAIKKGSNHTNQEIIDLFIETNIIHLPVFQPSDLLKGQKVKFIMNYYNNVLMQELYEKIGKYEKKQDTPISTVEPETFVVPGTIVEPDVVHGTVKENTKQNSEEFEDAISEGKKYTGTIKGHRGCRTRRRGCKGSRRRRVGGKYTKRISNKGKSPVRQTKRIKLKRKTHKRRPI